MLRRLAPLLAALLLTGAAMSQVTVPRLGVRGDVPPDLVDGLVEALREALAADGTEVDSGDLITPGIAGSLEPEFTRLIADVQGTRYAVSGEIAASEVGAEEPYLVNLIAVDVTQDRASDLITAALSPEDVEETARGLADRLAVFVDASIQLPEGDAGLFVSSEPRGAQVFVGDVPVGETADLDLLMLEPGRYRLEVRAEGFLPEVRSVDLRSGETAFVHVLLTAISGGSAQISSEPSARIYVDGELRGRTPATVPIRSGRHEIRLARDGFQPRVLDVPVRTYRVTRIETELEPLQEPLLYWPEQRETIVLIDGRLQPDGYAEGLEPGVHRIELRRLGDRHEVMRDVPSEGVFELDLRTGELQPRTTEAP